MGLRFAGLKRTVGFHAARPVAEALRALLADWPSHPSDAARGATFVSARGGLFEVASDYLEAPLRRLPVASAVCAVIADLAQAWSDERPGTLALHCGAVRTAAGLVAFTGSARAGKSTLLTRLGDEADWQVFCDDVLPLTPKGEAVALGLPPRLRLPLPAALGPRLQAFAARHCVLSDDLYGYVAVPNLAPHGTKAPLRVLVLLDRQPGAAAQLHALPEPEALQTLLAQEISETGATAEALPVLMRLLRRLTCLRLVYSDLEQAVGLLRAAFGRADGLKQVAVAPPLPVVPTPAGADPLSPAAMELHWQRLPGAVPRRLRGALVVWAPGQGRGLALNATGAAIWRLLADPCTGWQIAETLAQAFPQVPPARIGADVAALLGALVAAGHVQATPGPQL